jgi:hypothetical protein
LFFILINHSLLQSLDSHSLFSFSLSKTIFQSLSTQSFYLRIRYIKHTLYTLLFVIIKTTAKMVSTTINFSGLMCLFLTLGPATVLSAPAPQIPGLPVPDIINHSETTNEGGNSEFSAGSGVNVGIPGGPSVNVGEGVHSSHRGPCGPLAGDDKSAGAGVNVGIPGGPFVNAGEGEHEHHDGYPCPEPPVVIVPTTTASVQTWAPVIVPTNYPAAPVIVPTNYPAAPVLVPTNKPAAPAPMVPTYTTPIYVPHTTPVAYAPAVPIVKPSTPLIPQPASAPSASPSHSTMPVFNAGSSLAPASVLAVAVPVILAFFH